ncbi:excisionase family DNA-binding protein [Nocardioides sp. KR10-350]|uniref:excisionase family DNA-binding protein n=1 Tax=Nocardioides cheoyonin TaxID=3156615 RepID=UPI0032B4DB10
MSAQPRGLIDKRAAAQILGASLDSVDRWSSEGLLKRIASGRGYLLYEDEVRRFAAERHRWVSRVTAAEIVDCPVHVIEEAVRAGLIETRPDAHRRQPGLSRVSVEKFAKEWPKERSRRQRRAAGEAVAREREREERALRRLPPQDGNDDWLGVTEAARVLGISRSGVIRQIHDERLPATRVGDRFWLRRSHIENVARARRASRAKPVV